MNPADVVTTRFFPNPSTEKVFIDAISVPIGPEVLSQLAHANLAEVWMVAPHDTLHALLRPEHIALARALASDTAWVSRPSGK